MESLQIFHRSSKASANVLAEELAEVGYATSIRPVEVEVEAVLVWEVLAVEDFTGAHAATKEVNS